MIFRTFEDLIRHSACAQDKKQVVAAAPDLHTLQALFRAKKEGIVTPVLSGCEQEIRGYLSELGWNEELPEIYDMPEKSAACVRAVELVQFGKADFLMKGGVDTSVFLKAVVDKAHGLGCGGLMSHIAIFEVPGKNKLLTVVDGGMVPYPGLEEKKSIIKNTVEALRRMGYDCPKVGVLACVEKVNLKMPETVEADRLKTMNQEGIIENCVVEGPVSYDCAVSREIAHIKGYDSAVAGEADILVAPNIHAGNIMGKMLTCTCGARMAGFVAGAACPVVLSSRGASVEEKYLSILAAAAASTKRWG